MGHIDIMEYFNEDINGFGDEYVRWFEWWLNANGIIEFWEMVTMEQHRELHSLFKKNGEYWMTNESSWIVNSVYDKIYDQNQKYLATLKDDEED
jgi:hypothetical protein